MKYATDREYADPEKAARKLLEIASTIEPVQDGRIHIGKINAPFLRAGSPAEYGAALAFAIARGRDQGRHQGVRRKAPAEILGLSPRNSPETRFPAGHVNEWQGSSDRGAGTKERR